MTHARHSHARRDIIEPYGRVKEQADGTPILVSLTRTGLRGSAHEGNAALLLSPIGRARVECARLRWLLVIRSD